MIADFTPENGTLAYAGEDMAVRMEIQADGYLRLTAEKEGLSELRVLSRFDTV